MTAVSNIAEIYSFTDLVANSQLNEASYSLSVNLRSELSQIEAQTFATDYDFQIALASLFRSLHDAHTTYYAPKSYRNSFVVFPFKIKSAVIGGQQRIIIAEKFYPNDVYEQIFSTSISQYVGKTVSTIDGEDALQAVKRVADTLPYSKDAAGRFNRALQTDFSERSCAMYRIPPADTFTITFTDGSSAELPWMAVILRSYGGIADWTSDMLTTPAVSTAYDEAAPTMATLEDPEQLMRVNILRNVGRLLKPDEKLVPEAMNSVALASFIEKQPRVALKYKSILEDKKKADHMFVHSVYLPVERIDSKVVVRSPSAPTSLLVLKKMTEAADTFYLLYNNEVPIIKLTTFSPNDGSSYPWESSISVIREAIADSASNGYENLIIDLRGNGGGAVCLSFGFIRAIVSDFARKARAYERYDLRRSAFPDKLISAGYMANFMWADASHYNTSNVEINAYSDSSWYTDGPSYVRGGLPSLYSKKNFLNCDAQGGGRYWFATPSDYFFKKIIIVTDGLCGSACSLFATKLRYYGKAVIVTMGGFNGEQMESSTYAGGAVFEYNDIVARAVAMNLNVTYPRTNLAARVNWFEMYMGSQPLPREWIRTPGDFKLDYWDFDDHEAIYAAVTPIFAQIPEINNEYPYEPDVAAAGALPFSAMLVLASAAAALILSFC